MKICRDDVEALKAPDVLRAYCERELGAGRRQGALMFYRCPWGAHTRLKLEVTEKNGVGLAMCRACNRGGSVLDVAAGVLGTDAKRDYAAVVEHVAEVVGYALRDDDSTRRGKRRPARRRFTPTRPQEPRERADAARVEYLPPDAEKAALEAVRRAADNPDAMARYAGELGLPLGALLFHTDAKEAGALGLLGLSPDGKLQYVYTTYDDEGRLRVLYSKIRNKPNLPPYLYTPAGVAHSLWGVAALARSECRRVIITEGESDCLAVRAAAWAWLDDWCHNSPDDFPPAESWPLVLAKPGAGGFKREWLGTAWGRKLLRADVILAADNDTAGSEGAAKTASDLCKAGAKRVFIWQPPAGAKDAREALDPARPWLLADDIMTNRKVFQSNNKKYESDVFNQQ